MTQQPEWIKVFASDYSRLDRDATNVYAPELTIGIALNESESKFAVYRICCELCTYENGILSDNRFHKDFAVWFADEIDTVAAYAGQDASEMIAALCGDDLTLRAQAYESIASYFGYNEFDSYPLTESESEFAERINR